MARSSGNTTTRREILRAGVALSAAALAGSPVGSSAAAPPGAWFPRPGERGPDGLLLPTPEQMRGPYWPSPEQRAARFPKEVDNDLARVARGPDGAPREAEGRRLYLLGTLLDRRGRAIPGASLEVWQTCDRGRYLHPDDTREEAGGHDPGFQYYARVAVDRRGRWALRSVVPRSYPADESGRWFRPPHVHFRAIAGDSVLLTTQIYLDDPADPENEERHLALQARDRLLLAVDESRRHALVTRVEPLVDSKWLRRRLAAAGLDAALARDLAASAGARGAWFGIVVDLESWSLR